MDAIATQTKERKDWKGKLLGELEKTVAESAGKEKLSDTFRKFGEKHGVTAGNVSYYYYQYLTKNAKEKRGEAITESKIEEPKVKEYRVGDIVECKITGIKEYGAFGYTDDNQNCLLHISEIEDGYIENIFGYFKIGQRIKAKLIKIAPDGRLSLSTRSLENDNHEINITPIAPVKKETLREVKKEDNVSYIAVPNNKIDNNEYDNIVKFIKQYSGGNVSPKALDNITTMIAEYGVFNTTLAMVETLRDLDLSGFITSETQKKLESTDRLRRRS